MGADDIEVDLAAAIWRLQRNLRADYGVQLLRAHGRPDATDHDTRRLRTTDATKATPTLAVSGPLPISSGGPERTSHQFGMHISVQIGQKNALTDGESHKQPELMGSRNAGCGCARQISGPEESTVRSI